MKTKENPVGNDGKNEFYNNPPENKQKIRKILGLGRNGSGNERRASGLVPAHAHSAPASVVAHSRTQKLTTRVTSLFGSDSTMKQFLLLLDKEHHFIIKDLDEGHLLVDASKTEFIKQKLEELYEENTYVPIKPDQS